MLKEQVFQASSVAINYAEGPDNGAPIVLLHGISSRWQTFLPVLPGLMARHHVYALDHRGHGRSGRATGTYRNVDYGADAIEFIDKVVREPTAVMGHSLGAMAATVVGGKAQGRVSAVILEDPPMFTAGLHPKTSPARSRFAAYREMIEKRLSSADMLTELRRIYPNDDDASQRFRISSLRMLDPDVLTSDLDGRLREGFDPQTLLKATKCPVLLLKGSKSLGGALEDAEASRIAAWLDDCTLVCFNDVGHQIHTDLPERTLKTVTNFLESL